MIEATCRQCGQTFEPGYAEILAGVWRDCADCRTKPAAPKPEPATKACESCGRPLRAGNRSVCAQCLGVTL
jgi:hypothetical protein